MRRATMLALALATTSAHAQSSASFKLTESSVNAGGDPISGVSAASASFHISLDAIGDAANGSGLASASYAADGGFVGSFPPPGEVRSLRYTDASTMSWSPERSVGVYEVYRDALSAIPASFGTCFASGVSSEAAVDAGVPPTGQGWFYLVTARNRLGEEGTKGTQTGGAERPNAAPCP